MLSCCCAQVPQPRILVLSTRAYYRVTVTPKAGAKAFYRVDHTHRTEYDKLAGIECSPTCLKLFLTEGGEKATIGQTMGTLFGRVDNEQTREYLPVKPPYGWPSTDVLIEVMSTTFQKVCELCSAAAPTPFIVPPLLSPSTRSKGLAQRRASSAALAAAAPQVWARDVQWSWRVWDGRGRQRALRAR